MSMRYGYKASAEQFGPRELLDYSVQAESLGLEIIAISDHFQPWRHKGGHTPAVLPWLGEAIELIRKLWTEEMIPIYIAASGPLAARLTGRVGDGYIATSGKDPQLYLDLLGALKEGADSAGRDADQVDKFIEIKVSYDHDMAYAKEACHFWAPLALKPEEKTGIDDAMDMETAADKILDRAHTRFIVSNDPDEVVEKIAPYVKVGFNHLVFHGPGHDQTRFLSQFCADVLPRLHDRFGTDSRQPEGTASRVTT